jgi:hypothetical protein
MPGASHSAIKVTNISKRGLSLLISGSEDFLSFEDFPWFRDAPVGHILNVEAPSPATTIGPISM